MCPAQLLVTMDQVSEYTGIYNYVAEFNGAPYYAQNNGPGYVYKYLSYWYINNILGNASPTFYSSDDTKCPEEAFIWNNVLPAAWTAMPGFNVDIVSPSKSLRY